MTTIADIYLEIPAQIIRDRDDNVMIAARTADILLALERARALGKIEGVDIAQRIWDKPICGEPPVLHPFSVTAHTFESDPVRVVGALIGRMECPAVGGNL